MIYQTKDGDTVDRICWHFYQSTAMAVKVYNENRHLTEYGPKLPAGLNLVLPERKAVETVHPSVTLFG